MAVEIIKRQEGKLSEKQEVRKEREQISINDWGHLVVRCFDKPKESGFCKSPVKCSAKPNSSICSDCNHAETREVQGEECLIVFDKELTERIISFIHKVSPTHSFEMFLKDLAKDKTFPF